jgi:hypothetical protein
MAELALLTTLRIKTTLCITCGCVIGMQDEYYDRRLHDHRSYYCPNGHTQCFTGESEAEKNARLLREEQARHQRTLSRVNEVERERDRLKKRVKAGVCPCCKRTFKQLAAHMKHKHPDYK